jgi:hypothetical protein
MRDWKSSAAQYWEESRPQLFELHARLSEMIEDPADRRLVYLQRRMELLERRATLPTPRLQRLFAILPRVFDYSRYFNGWKSIAKDLTAWSLE